MKKFLSTVLGLILASIVVLIAMINIINIFVLRNRSFTLDLSLLRMDKKYMMAAAAIIAVIIILTVLSKISSNPKKKDDGDHKNFSHISSVGEAKKGLLRVQFKKTADGRWIFHTCSKLAYMDKMIDPLKKLMNMPLTFFRVDDRHKFNTVKTWMIADEETTMRAGMPIYMPRFRRKTIFLDPNDIHNLLLGTTNSGKSVSIMLQFIEMVRMSGECGVFNDPKGELYEYTAAQFKEDGYDVIKLNFVNPEASDSWSPLQLAWKEWKNAYLKYEKELKAWNEKGRSMSSSEKAQWLANRPEPDYSLAIEYITDCANILTFDANTKDPFWNDSARDELVGITSFLMEENTNHGIMDDETINFKSIKMVSDIGCEELTKDQMKLLETKSKTILGALLEKSRKFDDASTMNLHDFINAPEQTRQSIKKVMSTKINLLTMNEQIMRMTSKSSFELNDLGQKKMAIYLIVHDEKKTYYPLVTLFIKQLYETIINEARGNKGRLPIPVNILVDEFGNCPAFKDVQSMLTAGRSRGVRFTFAIQDTAQLEDIYGKAVAQTIQNNCSNTVYLLGSQPETLKNFSSMCGNHLVWLPARSMYESRPLISVDRLQHLNLGEVVIHRQRKSPFITRMIPYNKCKFYRGKLADPNELMPPKDKVNWLNPKDLLSPYGVIF